MCHDPTGRPPLPPIAGGAGATAERIVLEAADGIRFMASSATTPAPGGPGVLILPDIRGLHPFYDALAARFAETGAHAIAMDYFGRTAGVGERDDRFDHQPHTARMTRDGVSHDIDAAIAHLRSDAGGAAERVVTVGFCRGGRISFNQAADRGDLAGVIGFYGTPQEGGPDDGRSPISLVPRFRCPVLGLFGGADPDIPLEEVERFRVALDEAGVPNEIVVYEGAPHSFFDRRYEQHAEACDDAWTRVLRFVRGAEG